jgi:hypothetical protein
VYLYFTGINIHTVVYSQWCTVYIYMFKINSFNSYFRYTNNPNFVLTEEINNLIDICSFSKKIFMSVFNNSATITLFSPLKTVFAFLCAFYFIIYANQKNYIQYSEPILDLWNGVWIYLVSVFSITLIDKPIYRTCLWFVRSYNLQHTSIIQIKHQNQTKTVRTMWFFPVWFWFLRRRLAASTTPTTSTP